MSGSGYLLLVCLLTAAECDLVVFATGGYNVTLPCKYDVPANGLSSTCWGRGVIPASKCSDQLIATDGAEVREDSRVSSRYQLLGDLRKGDVSMKILNVSEKDSGQYGCRVEIAGWFNDLKHHFQLRVQKGYTVTEERKETGSDEAMDHTEGPVVTSVKTYQQPDLQLSSPWGFIGNTLRLSFIIFIPALLLIGIRSVNRQQTVTVIASITKTKGYCTRSPLQNIKY